MKAIAKSGGDRSIDSLELPENLVAFTADARHDPVAPNPVIPTARNCAGVDIDKSRKFGAANQVALFGDAIGDVQAVNDVLKLLDARIAIDNVYAAGAV